jgi:membrane fusion protein (multidrug efflux system)
MTGERNQSSSTNPLPAGERGVLAKDNAESIQAGRKGGPSGKHWSTRWRKLISGVVGVLILAAALWFGIPWIWFTLNTESTDDAYVNGHVTFVAPRVHG